MGDMVSLDGWAHGVLGRLVRVVLLQGQLALTKHARDHGFQKTLRSDEIQKNSCILCFP
jgi:hypothetical protein